MKGLQLKINDVLLTGAIEKGSTSVLLTCRDGVWQLSFASLNETAMVSYIWHFSDLKEGDKLSVAYIDVEEDTALSPAEIRDHESQEMMDQLSLKTYYQLKEELIREGLLPKAY